MALTPQTRITQGQVFSVGEAETETKITQAQVLAVGNIPAEELDITQVQTFGVVGSTADLQIIQQQILAVVIGTQADPKVRAWTFTLDGHDYYVLRLGDTSTLVYDTYSKQWSEWFHGIGGRWKFSTGTNWLGAGAYASSYGSNIVTGDDTLGVLWLLDPSLPWDEDAIVGPEEIHTFTRQATGQIPQVGRKGLPCYDVDLTADYNIPSLTGAAVTLKYSDDEGENYINAGSITAEQANLTKEYSWRSLGTIYSPGRLFVIEDDGAVVRISGLEVNDDGG